MTFKTTERDGGGVVKNAKKYWKKNNFHNICFSILHIYSMLRTIDLLRWVFIKENKKTRTRPRKQSRKQEKKKENKNSTKKAIKKKRKNFLFFLITFLVEFLFSCFLTFLFSFINSSLWTHNWRENLSRLTPCPTKNTTPKNTTPTTHHWI